MDTMRSLVYHKTKSLAWETVPRPVITDPRSAIVRPLTVSTCDFDGVVVWGLARLRGPVPMGHEGEGIVESVGSAVERFQPGDRVVVPWKISCGTCVPCRRGFTAVCESVQPEDAYGWGPTGRERGGFLSDAILVPYADAMLVPLPPEADPLRACGVADNISDGWRAVAGPLAARAGGTVLVAGLVPPGSIGLYAAGIAHTLGASRVVYADADPRRLGIAETLGAEPLHITSAADLAASSERFDVTVDASGDVDVLRAVLERTGPGGVCTSTAAMMYREPVPFPVFELFRRAVTFATGWAHTRAIEEAPLAAIAAGTFDPSPVTTAVVPWSDAADALVEPYVKLIVQRSA